MATSSSASGLYSIAWDGHKTMSPPQFTETLMTGAQETMSPVAEYDLFQYKQTDEPVLPLEDAAQVAARLRQMDPSGAYFYRVVPADPNLSGFRVVKVPTSK